MTESGSPTEKNSPDIGSMLFAKAAAVESLNANSWRSCFPEFVGRSQSISRVLEAVHKIAKSDSSVLVFGESGTGKELIAASLHRLSARSEKKFVAINCSAIPESLLESELFGHVKGAFTGALNNRIGLFEQADGGTLFLDEIGDMPLSLQVKLLRFLQEKQFTAVGGTTLKSVNVRVVAATNVDLEKAVQNGKFRLDLYYRLNVLPIYLPPLRERGRDIEDLLLMFLEQANKSNDLQDPCYFSETALEMLSNYRWPGNVRELQNLVERLVVILNGGRIEVEHLPPEIRKTQSWSTEVKTRENIYESVLENQSPTRNNFDVATTNPHFKTIYPKEFGQVPHEGINLNQFVEDLENRLIRDALDRTNNNKNQAAKLLGLNRTTLVEKIKKRKIEVPKD